MDPLWWVAGVIVSILGSVGVIIFTFKRMVKYALRPYKTLMTKGGQLAGQQMQEGREAAVSREEMKQGESKMLDAVMGMVPELQIAKEFLGKMDPELAEWFTERPQVLIGLWQRWGPTVMQFLKMQGGGAQAGQEPGAV